MILLFCLTFTSCNSSSVEVSVEKYGYSNIDIPLDLYGLKDRSVIRSSVDGEDTCYDVNIKYGFVDSNIRVYWKNQKYCGNIDIGIN